MDLNKYFQPLIRWWWLLAAALILSAATSFFVLSRQAPVYEASTTLIFGQSYASPNPTSGQIYLEQQMAAIYADLGNREVVWTKVQEALGMNWLPRYQVRSLPNTALIVVTVNDTDPQRAKIVADEIARQLILQTPSTQKTGDENQQAFLKDQITRLQDQIEATQEEIVHLRGDLGDINSARQIQDTQAQIAAQEAKLTTLQATYASLISNTAGSSVNTLTVIGPAMVPTVQSGPNKWLLTILSAAIGLVFGVIGAYAIEYFDRTIKSTEEVAELTQLTILGRLKFSRKVKDRPQHLLSDPFSPETNVFRSIRTQLEKDGVGHSLRTILVISPDASEGKSTISLNLALIFSRIKKKVILVDSDYYKSSLSLILDAPQTPGLIDILEGKNELEDGLIPVCDGQILFLPSGGSRPEGVVSYSSEAMETVLTDLKIEAEVAIIDSPPYIIADAQDLAHQVDGILIIVRNRQTQHKALSKMMEQIRRLEIPLLGVVVNGIPQEEKGYQQYYYYRQHTPHKTGPTSSPVDNNHSDEIKGEELSSLPHDKGISQK